MEKLIVDNELCDGCQDCEKACEGVHGVPRITIHEFDGSYFPIRCQQCEDAPCEIICPTGAMSNLGVDVTKCIACGFCAMACPFGAISSPACVKACSKRAIAVHDIANVIKRKQREHIEKIYGLDKPAKKKGLLSVITTDTRARKPLDGE